MRFHPEKCTQMSVELKDKPERVCTLGDGHSPLKVSYCEKDIDVIIDCKLNFEHHIAAKSNKANSILEVIHHTFQYMDERTLVTLYTSLVISHLEFANHVWDPHMAKHIVALENAQHCDTRMIPALGEMAYEDYLKRVKLPTLSYCCLRWDMIETYKFITGVYDRDVTTGLYNIRIDSNT